MTLDLTPLRQCSVPRMPSVDQVRHHTHDVKKRLTIRSDKVKEPLDVGGGRKLPVERGAKVVQGPENHIEPKARREVGGCPIPQFGH